MYEYSPERLGVLIPVWLIKSLKLQLVKCCMRYGYEKLDVII